MACPTCGGLQRRAVAPGFWECESPVTELFQTAQPFDLVGAAPVGARTRPCGTRYQEGQAAGAPSCRCGMFAVATCTECGQPLCGDCLRRVSGHVLCVVDAQRVHAQMDAPRLAEERQRQVRMAEAAARNEQAHAKIPALLEQLRAAGSPGSHIVPLRTSELKQRRLRSAIWTERVTYLSVWTLGTGMADRNLAQHDRPVWCDITVLVDEDGHYFSTWQRHDARPPAEPLIDMDSGETLEHLFKQWAARANRKAGPIPSGRNAQDAQDAMVRWDTIYEVLASHLLAGTSPP